MLLLSYFLYSSAKDLNAGKVELELTINAEYGIQPVNKIFVDISSPGKLNSMVVPVIVLG